MKKNINLRQVLIISVFAICIISINLAVFFKLTEKAPRKEKENKEHTIIDTAVLVENFNNIFDNKINYQNNEIENFKRDNKKELVYTNYINQQRVENLYELNINIPAININSEEANKINNEINTLFYNKVKDILNNNKNNNVVYNVNYKAYINDNILSLIIRANLKEDQNPQRVIIKTYNYNLSSNEQIDIFKILDYRNLAEEKIQNNIIATIENASRSANKYNELGYKKYLRNPKDDMYKLENTKVYFIGENKALYIIYPYGNTNYTSELDLLVI